MKKWGYFLKLSQSVVVLTVFLVVFPIKTYASSYYIDSSCLNSGDGTCNGTSPSCVCASDSGKAGPFNSIAKMQEKPNGYVGGDNIFLKKGQRFLEKLTISSSGVEGNLITYGSYGSNGDQPMILGDENSGVDFNFKNYIRLTQLHVNGPIKLNGNNNQIDYIVSNYSLGNTITVTGSSNALYNNTLINNSYTPISILGNDNVAKNNIVYSNYASANVFINVDPKVSKGPEVNNNLYYGTTKNIQYGINSSLASIGNNDVDKYVARMKQLGVTVSRDDFDWSRIETNKGSRDWSHTDYFINKLVENNIEPLAVLDNSPAWANKNSDIHHVPYEITDLLKSGDFEIDKLSSDWKTDGNVESETKLVHGGFKAVKITNNSSIKQTINVKPGMSYSVQFWTRHDAETYEVKDISHNSEIISKRNGDNWGDTYVQKEILFKAPEGCTQVEVSFYGPLSLGNYLYIDDIHAYEMTGPTFQAWKSGFVDFAREAAKRYKGKMHKYEVWNEASLTYFWKPMPNIYQYMELYSAVSEAIHAIDPSAEVAVQIGAWKRSSSDAHGGEFLQKFYENNIYPDAVSYHVYTDDIANPPNLKDNNSFGSIAAIRKIMVDNGQSDKKIWITEFGWGLDMVSLKNQASYIKNAFEILRDLYSDYVSVACVYTLKEGDAYGIYDANGKERPSALVINKFLNPSFIWKGVEYNFDNWKLVTNQDKNSIYLDPLFEDVSNSDLRIKELSPAVNNGSNVGLKTDFVGNSITEQPDIGACEYTPLKDMENQVKTTRFSIMKFIKFISRFFKITS